MNNLYYTPIEYLLIGNGDFAIIDADNYDRLKIYNWHKSSHGYAFRNENYKRVYLHHNIVDRQPNMVCDHINRNKLINVRLNIRIVTQQKNSVNKEKLNKKFTSKYKGVHWNKKNSKWAVTYTDGTNRNVAYFLSEDEAGLFYNNHMEKTYGECAFLNKLPDNVKELNKLYRDKNNKKPIRSDGNKMSSEYIGVGWSKNNNAWVSYAWKNGNKVGIKQSKNQTEVVVAYNEWILKEYGVCDKLNKISDEDMIKYEEYLKTKQKPTSNYNGVSSQKINKWRARHRDKMIYFGNSEIEAARSYDKHLIENNGDLNKLNFPEDYEIGTHKYFNFTTL